MLSSPFLLLAATAACIFWALWQRPWSANVARLDLPLVEFDDADNARDEAELKGRYTNEDREALEEGLRQGLSRGALLTCHLPQANEALHYICST